MLQQHNSLDRKIQMKLYHQNLHHKRDQEGYQFFLLNILLLLLLLLFYKKLLL